MSDVVPKDELRAAIEARKELGTEMRPAVIDSFVERVERRLAERAGESERSLERKRDHQKEMAQPQGVPLGGLCALDRPPFRLSSVIAMTPGLHSVSSASLDPPLQNHSQLEADAQIRTGDPFITRIGGSRVKHGHAPA